MMPNPILSWRSLWEFISFLLSFMCMHPILSRPIILSNFSKTSSKLFKSYPASWIWQVSMQTIILFWFSMPSIIYFKSSKVVPSSVPLPAMVSKQITGPSFSSKTRFNPLIILLSPRSLPRPTWLPGWRTIRFIPNFLALSTSPFKKFTAKLNFSSSLSLARLTI